MITYSDMNEALVALGGHIFQHMSFIKYSVLKLPPAEEFLLLVCTADGAVPRNQYHPNVNHKTQPFKLRNTQRLLLHYKTCRGCAPIHLREKHTLSVQKYFYR